MYNLMKEVSRLENLSETQQKLIELYKETTRDRDEIISDLRRLVNLQQIEIDELKKDNNEKGNQRDRSLGADSAGHNGTSHPRQFFPSRDKLNTVSTSLRTVELPHEQIKIVRNALKHYQDLVDDSGLKLECLTLSYLFLYETRVSVPEANADHFYTLHGVDFPQYNENGIV